MAASSPVPSNNSNDTGTTNGNTPPRRSTLLDPNPPKQNLRGLNKPKCFQCGNVARSRCPYQSCKSCCAKAQNPCHIHVLKPNATFLDKPTASSSPLFDHPSTDAPPSGASLRLSSLRQLSNNFAQFNGAQVPLRARRPLSRKDAAAINAWRFSKLKEYNDQNIEAETEAFDRYMQNVSLLEEAFFVNTSLEGLTPDGPPIPDSATSISEDEKQKLIMGMKVKLKSNVERADKCRQRIRDLVDRGLRKLQKLEFDDQGGSSDMDDPNGEGELKRPKKAEKWRAERTTAINDLLDKLNKARSEEEQKACLEMKLQLFNQKEAADALTTGKSDVYQTKDDQMSEEQNDEDASLPRQESDTGMAASTYSLPKLCRTIEISQEILSDIDEQFTSLDKITDL